MKGIFVVVVTFAVAVCVSAKKYDRICERSHVGDKIRNPDDCSQYFQCAGTVNTGLKKCIHDLLFDTQTMLCKQPANITCDNKPLTKYDPCPGTTGYVVHPYANNPVRYILCVNGKNEGMRWDMTLKGKTHLYQRYFEDCPKVGKYKVRYARKEPALYFECIDGVHTRTRKAKSGDILVDTGFPLELMAKNNPNYINNNNNNNNNNDKIDKNADKKAKKEADKAAKDADKAAKKPDKDAKKAEKKNRVKDKRRFANDVSDSDSAE